MDRAQVKPTVPCHHCGRPIRALPTHDHPWRHVETGKSWCPPVTKATPTDEHRWMDVSTYSDKMRRLECTHCGEMKTEAYA